MVVSSEGASRLYFSHITPCHESDFHQTPEIRFVLAESPSRPSFQAVESVCLHVKLNND